MTFQTFLPLKMERNGGILVRFLGQLEIIVTCSLHWSQLKFLVSYCSFGRCRIKEQTENDKEEIPKTKK